MKNKSISEFIMDFFQNHPKQDLPHGPVVDWVEEEYKKVYNKKHEMYGDK